MSNTHFKMVLAGDIAAKGVGALYTIAIIRMLSPEQLADYIIVSAFVVMSVSSFSGFFNRHFIVIAKESTAAISYRRWQSVCSGIAYLVAGAALAPDINFTLFIIGFLGAVAASAFDFGRTYSQKNASFSRYAIAELVRVSLLLPLTLFILFFEEPNAVGYLLAAQAISYLIALRFLPSLPSSPGITSFRAIFMEPAALHLIAYFILLGIFGQLPVLILKSIGDPYNLASFGGAMRYYGLALAVVIAANVVVLPQLSKARDYEELLILLKKTKSMVISGMALLSAIALFGFISIPYLDGGKYAEAPCLFVILCTALIPGIVLAPITAAFFRLGFYKDLVASMVLANIVCALTASVLHEFEYGSYAAAISLPFAVTTQLVFLVLVFFRRH